MATYLLTWNPNKYHWEDLQECIAEVEEQGYCEARWSCGTSKRIQRGDRLFLMRLGEEPRGILASGSATSDVYEDEHWEVGHSGDALYVELNFGALLDPEQEILSLAELESISASMTWTPQASGITIDSDTASELEARWARFLAEEGVVHSPEEVDSPAAFHEGATKRLTVNAYERNPEARRQCIESYGVQCTACGFDFGETYGEVGEGFIHVHHLKPLSEVGDEYKVDTEDLRPVCPNCHAMIHRRKPPYSIEEIQEMLAMQSKV